MLFERETVERYTGYLRRVLAGMAADETRPVDRLTLLSDEERRLPGAAERGGGPGSPLYRRGRGCAPGLALRGAGRVHAPRAGGASVQTVTEGVYLLERLGGGDRSLFVDMGDHVLVVEAPVSSAASETALGLIRQTLPGEPVRYVVVTHRHIDHIGGARPYVTAGAVLVAPAGAEPALRQIAAFRRTLAAGPVDRAPGEPRVGRWRTGAYSRAPAGG